MFKIRKMDAENILNILMIFIVDDIIHVYMFFDCGHM